MEKTIALRLILLGVLWTLALVVVPLAIYAWRRNRAATVYWRLVLYAALQSGDDGLLRTVVELHRRIG